MKLSISRDELHKALYVTQSIVERKTTMPILSNVILSTADGQLKIASTDLEITAVTQVVADVKVNGSTTVNAKVLSDIVRELSSGMVELSLSDGERLEVTAHNTKVKIIGVSAEEFPSLPGIQIEIPNRISTDQFLEMVSKTLYAVSTDETRFNLNGVCFEMDKKKSMLNMVATDGHRLALIKRPVEGFDFEGSVIVPRKGLAEIKKVLDNEDESEVGIAITEGFFLLQSSDTKISMRLIDGEFPDYQQVLPKDKGVIASTNGTELSQALKRVALMVTDKAKCVKLDFAPETLRISSSSPELGEANEE
ncbi:MAG: DNA polymerase III subunit beta, partial [Bdellovibrionales bacterium]|nr:DNA polymerase III subunit beta [Bdellovibrionales bacterium]